MPGCSTAAAFVFFTEPIHQFRGHSRCFSLLGDLFHGKQEFVVDVQRGSHKSSISHLMRDANGKSSR